MLEEKKSRKTLEEKKTDQLITIFNELMEQNGLQLLVDIAQNTEEDIAMFSCRDDWLTNPEDAVTTCLYLKDVVERILGEGKRVKKLDFDHDGFFTCEINLTGESHAFIMIIYDGMVYIHNTYGGHLKYVVETHTVGDFLKLWEMLPDSFESIFGIQPLQGVYMTFPKTVSMTYYSLRPALIKLIKYFS